MNHAPAQPLSAAVDQRSAEILDKVRHAFAQKGFDGASMQDLARAAGMSVGNFYRYFPSKAAIVAALVRRDMDRVERDFAAILRSDAPIAALRETIRRRIEEPDCGENHIYAEITAAARRRDDIGELTAGMEHLVTGYLVTVFSRASGLPLDEARARFGAHARLLMMMVTSLPPHAPAQSEDRDHLIALVLRTIDRVLDEIVCTDPKG